MTTMTKKSPHRGSSLDALLKKEGVFEEFHAAAIKNAIAFRLSKTIKDNHLT